MCRHDSHGNLSAEEEIAAEESLSIYCKPVELYNILQRRAAKNVFSFSYFIFLKLEVFSLFHLLLTSGVLYEFYKLDERGCKNVFLNFLKDL